MATDNVQYNDRLFNFLFGSEENKEWTLSLYNAVNGSHYTDPSMIRITTIRGSDPRYGFGQFTLITGRCSIRDRR